MSPTEYLDATISDVYRFFLFEYDKHFKRNIAHFYSFNMGVSVSINDGTIENSDALIEFLSKYWEEWNR